MTLSMYLLYRIRPINILVLILSELLAEKWHQSTDSQQCVVCGDMPDAELIHCCAGEVSNSTCHRGDLHGRKVNSTAAAANNRVYNILRHRCTDRPSYLQFCQHYDSKEFTTLTTMFNNHSVLLFYFLLDTVV